MKKGFFSSVAQFFRGTDTSPDQPESERTPVCYQCAHLSPGPAGGLPMCDIHGLWIHDAEADRGCDSFEPEN